MAEQKENIEQPVKENEKEKEKEKEKESVAEQQQEANEPEPEQEQEQGDAEVISSVPADGAQKKKRKKKKKAKNPLSSEAIENMNKPTQTGSVPVVENQPKPSRPQTVPEPTIPIASMYTNGKFPRGVTQEYHQDFNTWRTTHEEKRHLQKLTDEDVEPFRHAAEVHRQTRQWAQTWIKPGMTYLDIGDKIENKVRDLIKAQGTERGLAFPCGLSMNNIAAHWAPGVNDKLVLGEHDVVKVDFGTHVNGFIVDSAWTFCFDPQFQPLLDCVKEATYAGVKTAGIDARLSDLGEAIQEVMESHEVTIDGKTFPIKSVRNLCGHSLGQYTIHAGKSIPLVKGNNTTRLEEGDVIAIETFGSTGKGQVHDSGEVSHYMVDPDASLNHVKGQKARELFNFLKANYSTLAFARRWLEGKAPKGYQLYLKQLVDTGVVNPYPPLCDTNGSYVAQFEHTVYLKPSSKEIISKGTDY